SDGISFVRLEDRWYDRVMDPVIEAFERRGARTFKITPLSEAHTPRVVPSRFVQPIIDYLKLTAASRESLDLPDFSTFFEAACDMFGETVPSRRWLQVEAARL